MKSKDDCRSLEEWEEELSRYTSSLMGYDYYPSVTSEILLMPEEGAREHMRTQVMMSLSARLFNFLSTTNEDVKRLVLETGKGEPRLAVVIGTGSEDMEQNKELEKDIGKLQDKIGEALDYYLELRQKYGELGGWEMVEDKLCLAIGWADMPLQPMPEEEA